MEQVLLIFLPKSRGIVPAAPPVPTGQLLRLPVVFRGSGITKIWWGKVNVFGTGLTKLPKSSPHIPICPGGPGIMYIV